MSWTKPLVAVIAFLAWAPSVGADVDPCKLEPTEVSKRVPKHVHIACQAKDPRHPEKVVTWSCLAYTAKYKDDYDDCRPHNRKDRQFECIFLSAAKGEREKVPGTCGPAPHKCNPPGLERGEFDDLPVAALIPCLGPPIREEGLADEGEGEAAGAEEDPSLEDEARDPI